MESRWKKFKPYLRYHRIPVIVLILSFIIYKYCTTEDFSRYSNGQIKQEGRQENGMNEGRWIWYYENGNRRITGFFKKGKRTDLWTNFYSNGNPASERNYENDRLNGKFADYYRNGKKQKEGYFKNDQLNGIISNFGEDGKLISKEQYSAGKFISKEIIHNE